MTATATTRLYGFPTLDFPAVPVADWTTAVAIDGMDRRSIAAVLRATGDNYGVQIRATATHLQLCGTDGHRLCVATVGRTNDGPAVECTIPVSGCKAIGRVGEITRLTADGNHLWVDGAIGSVAVRLLSGRYPDVDAIVNRPLPHKAHVDAAVLLDMIERSLICQAGEPSATVKIAIGPGRIATTAVNATTGGWYADSTVAECNDRYEATFNSAYLTDFLAAFNRGGLTIRYGDSNSHLHIQPDDTDCVYVLMPMKR